MSIQFIRITHATANKTNALNITMNEDMDSRKSRLRVSQKSVEEKVKAIHDAVKCSVYMGTDISHSSLDYYDEGDGEYSVAGARILKGERSVRDDSWEKTSIPKDWIRHTRVQFKTNKITSPIIATLKAFGQSVTEAQVDEIKKLLKKDQKAFLVPKYENSRSYMFGTVTRCVGFTVSNTCDDDYE